MYMSGKNPLHKVTRNSEDVVVPKGLRQRRLHKAFLRYHDPENWPVLREALKNMGRADLIGNGRKHLVPSFQPRGTGSGEKPGQRRRGKAFRTQHTRAETADPGNQTPAPVRRRKTGTVKRRGKPGQRRR